MRAFVLAVLGCVLSAPFANAAPSALFDFNDFPAFGETSIYQCNGKDYCSAQDVSDLGDGGTPYNGTVSTTRNGITGTFSRSGQYFDIWEPGSPNLAMTTGNDPLDWDLFLADFDRNLVFGQVDITPPSNLGNVGYPDSEAWSVLELWSDLGGSGDLVARELVTLDDWLGGASSTLALHASEGQTFRSMVYGRVWSEHPDCRVDCDGYSEGDFWPQNNTATDNIFVTAVPEPASALLVVAGTVLMSCNARRRGRRA